MRAMRAALPALSRTSARAPSRLVSTEAFAPPTPLSTHIEQFVPTAVIFTLLISIASVSAYYNGELMSLKKEIEGKTATLTKQIEGTTSTLTKQIEGTTATLKSDLVGILKEVDAKNTGTKDAVDAKILGFKEAADLKVRSRSALGQCARSNPLAHPPLPPPCSTRPSDELVAVVVAVAVAVAVAVSVVVVFGRCICGIGRYAETKVKHWFKLTCAGGVRAASRAWVLDASGPSSGSSGSPGYTAGLPKQRVLLRRPGMQIESA